MRRSPSRGAQHGSDAIDIAKLNRHYDAAELLTGLAVRTHACSLPSFRPWPGH
jgi:hypothetical protein